MNVDLRTLRFGGAKRVEVVRQLKAYLARHRGGGLDRQHLDTKIRPFVAKIAHWLTPAQYAQIRRLLEDAYGITTTEAREVFDDFAPCVPTDGFLRVAYEYSRESQPPTPFFFFSFLTVLGACLSRNIYIDRGIISHIYPNMVVWLIGPSGIGKNTAADIAIQVGMASNTFRWIGAEKSSPEFVTREIVKYSRGLLYAPEVSTLLGKQKYNEGFIQILTRVWDCPDFLPIGTGKHGKQVGKNIAISMLAGTNGDWLSKAMPADAFSGGFFARIVAVYQDKPGKAVPNPPAADQKSYLHMIEHLVKASMTCRGPVKRTKQAKELHEDYHRYYFDNLPHDDQLRAFHLRMPEHLLRIAMLLSVGERIDETVVIRAKHIEQSAKILQWISNYTPKVYEHSLKTLKGL